MNYKYLRETRPKYKKGVGYYKNLAWRKKVKEYFNEQRNKYYEKIGFATCHLSVFSQENIKNPTLAEIRFEDILKTFNLQYKKQPFFRKLKSSYIPDFVLEHPYYLIIEVDGEYHANSKQFQYDKKRDRLFGCKGYKTIRFKNKEVFENPQQVKNRLDFEIKQQFKWNHNCKARESIFWDGALSAIKPTKPIKATQESSSLAENPSL
jgi:very-short-patch-repair endonuclease